MSNMQKNARLLLHLYYMNSASIILMATISQHIWWMRNNEKGN